MSVDFAFCYSGANIAKYLLNECNNLSNTQTFQPTSNSTVEQFQNFDLDVPY